MTERIRVLSPDGTAGSIPADQAEHYAARGFTALTPEIEAQRAEAQAQQDAVAAKQAAAQAEYSGPLGKMIAGTAGTMRGITGPLTDMALIHGAGALGGDAMGERARQVLESAKDANPELSLATELGGTALTLGGGKAVGALARGGELLGVLPRALGEGATLAAKATGKLVGTGAVGLAGRAAQYAAPRIAASVAEAVPYALAGQIDEDVLGGHDITGEKLFAAGAKGALFGGAVGVGLAGLGGIGKLLRRAPTAESIDKLVGTAPGLGKAVNEEAASLAALDRVAEEHGGQAAADVHNVNAEVQTTTTAMREAGAPAKIIDASAEAIIAKRASTPQEAEALRKVYRDSASAVVDYEDELQRSTEKLRDTANKVLDVEGDIHKISFGESKAKRISEIVDKSNPSRSLRMADEIRTGVAHQIDEIEQVSGGVGEAGVGVNKVKRALDQYDRARVWSQANETPADQVASAFVDANRLKQAVGKAAGMGQSTIMRTPVQWDFHHLYHEIIPKLENETAWGVKAATMQREVNSATSKKLETLEGFKNAFVDKWGTSGGNLVEKVQSSDVYSFLSNAGDVRNSEKEAYFRKWISDTRGQIAAVEKHHELGAAEVTKFTEAKRALDSLDTQLEKAHADAKVIRNIKKIQAVESAKSLGGVTGAALDFFTRPMVSIQRLANTRRMVERLDKGVRRAVEGAVSSKAAAEMPERVSRTDTIASVEHVRQLATNQDATLHAIHEHTAELTPHAPVVTSAVASTATRALMYLSSHAPPGRGGPTAFDPDAKLRYSDSDLASYQRRKDAALDPVSVLNKVAHHQVDREGIETLQAVYPKIYEEMRQQTIEEITKRGGSIPRETRIQLGILLGFPADASQEPALVKAIQATKVPAAPPKGQPAPQQRGSKRPMKYDASQFISGSDRIAQNTR